MTTKFINIQCFNELTTRCYSGPAVSTEEEMP